MAWAHNAVLPFFVLVMGMKAKLVIHPLYHSKKINCNTTNFPNNEWEAEVKNIIVKAMRTALGDLAEESNNSKDKKKRKSNTGIMKAQNKRCKIEGCEEPLASAGKVWLVVEGGKFICLNYIVPKLEEELRMIQAKNAGTHCPLDKSMQNLIDEYAPEYANNDMEN
ncbi:unnamed protein product [Vitrella brassicaformis CCMP3155]|uniref:Uncharacterized protein n=1 Tax=Vitrella brassicaformis (strain CCMP3155) TaxID=1169540 RepID=A0A0G4H0I1_VITBC|nr:unnamed protein product [Vitrella brassicaformis CCMP3155]|eukprot:CEM37023.1 unnamed protein product [Vitrella brassicaformis CCMP3155]